MCIYDEGEITLPNTQAESIRNKQNIHTPKKRPCLVRHKLLLSLLYTGPRQAEKGGKKDAAEILTLKTSVGMEQNQKWREAKLITETSEKAD